MIKNNRLFKIESSYQPAGDQPNAINEIVSGLQNGLASQTLLGVTGSGKTFTVANVIENVQRPTIILVHNKTLAAQLYGEFKEFFPEMLSNISYHILITINLRLMSHHRIRLLRRIHL